MLIMKWNNDKDGRLAATWTRCTGGYVAPSYLARLRGRVQRPAESITSAQDGARSSKVISGPALSIRPWGEL